MYKIVASDMDETFLAHDHSIPAANVEAIRRMRELGILFVPASGRAYGSVMESISSLPPELMEGSYVISYNGGCLNRYGDPKPLMSHSLPFETIKRLYDYGVSKGLGVHVYEVSGKVWASHLQQAERDYLAGHMAITEFEDDSLEFLRDVPLAKILFVKPDGLPYLHEVADAMPASLTEGTSTTFSSGRYLEFNPEGVDKAYGLTKLAELLGVPLSDTIACGDALNDLPMIEAAGCGVAVSNATDGIEKHAQLAATSSCDDGILAEVVQKVIEPQVGTGK